MIFSLFTPTKERRENTKSQSFKYILYREKVMQKYSTKLIDPKSKIGKKKHTPKSIDRLA